MGNPSVHQGGMHFLLTNDDGYQAPGLEVLAQSLRPLGAISVVAPDRDRSGASHSLTLDVPIRSRKAANGFYYVNGTPTDCVHLAITGLLSDEPDMVISGINSGANLGDDILYSGTVAAAMEGRFLGRPAMAISLVAGGAGSAMEEPSHFRTAADVVLHLLRALHQRPLPADTLLNVNVPDLPYRDLRGCEITRLGYRHRSEGIVKALDPRLREVYWIGAVGAEQDAGAGTDFHAVAAGRVSITPLQTDLTRHSQVQALSDWIKDVGMN